MMVDTDTTDQTSESVADFKEHIARSAQSKRALRPRSAVSVRDEEAFRDYYNKRMGEIASRFRLAFRIALLMVGLVTLLFVLPNLGFADPVSLAEAITYILNAAVIFWVMYLVQDYAGLQNERSAHELNVNVARRKGMDAKMNEVLAAAQERAKTMITNQNGNLIVNIGSGSIGDVQQEYRFDDRSDVAQVVALLLAYTSAAGSPEAEKASRDLAEEAAKDQPNKSKLVDLWTRIVAALPRIANVTEITQGIKALLF